MSRRLAREFVLHMLYTNDFVDADSRILIKDGVEYNYSAFAGEHELYREPLSKAQEKYISSAVDGVISHMPELDSYIERYSVGWSVGRISIIARCILRLSMFEMLYMQIPVGASVNEALELCKKYDNEDAAAFINGILGAFVTGELKQ